MAHIADPHREADAESLLRQVLKRGDIDDPVVIQAMARVPRERFVNPGFMPQAYCDCALPIDCDQTISQPYVVALMTQLVGARPGRRILEIGTGSGYQAAVLAATGAEVWSVEILATLATQARKRFDALGLRVHTRVADGRQGWPEEAPFDGILVTAAPQRVPQDLVDQLAIGGSLVVPLGGPSADQDLWRLLRTGAGDKLEWEKVTGVRFVPMTGRVGASFMPAPSSDTMGHGLDRDRRSSATPGARHRK